MSNLKKILGGVLAVVAGGCAYAIIQNVRNNHDEQEADDDIIEIQEEAETEDLDSVETEEES